MKRYLIAALSTLLLSMMTLPSAHAHGFYYYVDIISELKTDDQKNLTGIRQTWLYRPEVTEIMLEGLDLSAAKREEVLRDFGATLLKDLGKWSYFTELRVNGDVIARNYVSDYQLELIDKQLKLTLLQPLSTPQSLTGKKLEIDMADPEGMGIFLHNSANNTKLPANLASSCQTSLEKLQTLPIDDTKFEHGKPVQLAIVQC